MSQRQCTKRTPKATPRLSGRVSPWTEGEGSEQGGSVAWHPVTSAQPNYVSDATWTDLDEHGGVLQIHERLANLMLSLYVLVPTAGATTSSWWATADGSWLGAALVGLA